MFAPHIPSAKKGLAVFTIDPALANAASPRIKHDLPVLLGPCKIIVLIFPFSLHIHFQKNISNSSVSMFCFCKMLCIANGHVSGACLNVFGSHVLFRAVVYCKQFFITLSSELRCKNFTRSDAPCANISSTVLHSCSVIIFVITVTTSFPSGLWSGPFKYFIVSPCSIAVNARFAILSFEANTISGFLSK